MAAYEKVGFSFGRNWQSYRRNIQRRKDDRLAVQMAINDIVEWLGQETVRGKTVVDVGCGSGIHSLAFHLLGARRIVSFDMDPDSVAATITFWASAGEPNNWKIVQGSVLDDEFMNGLGSFDIVYSWGVLHHTGDMWRAIGKCRTLIGPEGLFWMSIYTKGPNYSAHVAVKERFNAASWFGQKRMIWKIIAKRMAKLTRTGQNPFKWNKMKQRGMTSYHDLIDWLGGLPYEVAGKDEIEAYCCSTGLQLVKSNIRGEGACSIYLLKPLKQDASL